MVVCSSWTPVWNNDRRWARPSSKDTSAAELSACNNACISTTGAHTDGLVVVVVVKV